jgi:hypothetical protein
MVMPIRFDDTLIDGLFSIDGYVSAAGRAPEDVADVILDRLDANPGAAEGLNGGYRERTSGSTTREGRSRSWKISTVARLASADDVSSPPV